MAGIHDQPTEKRQKRAKRVILLVIGLMLVAGLICNYWPMEGHFTISRETTYVTGPLNEDGTVNYVAALNERLSKGVTPENNAAPLLIRAQAVYIEESVRARVFEMLQMEPLPEEDIGGGSLEYFVEEMWPKGAPKGATTRPSPDDVAEHSERLLKRAMAGPWSADELPAVAAWLKENEKRLALFGEAAKRPRYYLPLASRHSPERLFDAAMRSPLCSLIAEKMSARAMLRAHGGATDAAMDDILAIHRLARLAGEPPLVIDRLIAIAVERSAARCAGSLAASGKLTGAQARRLLADLQALPPIPDIAEAIDQGERFIHLDCVMVLYRWRRGDGLDEDQFAPQWCYDYGKTADLDPMLRKLNRWYDRMVDVQRLRNPSRRARAAEVLKNDVGQFKVHAFDNGGKKILAGRFLGRVGRGLLSDGLSDVVVCLLVPVVTISADERDEAVMHLEVAKIALALAALKAEKGHFPKKLSELSPGYVKKVPVDIFAEGPLIYKRDGKGYLLYSVGRNMKDDGGVEDENGDEDDIAVRVK